MFIKSIRPSGLLSFSPQTPALALGPLNVLIGTNGAGKSNLVEALRFLQLSTGSGGVRQFVTAAKGKVSDWIWKGAPQGPAVVEVVLDDKGWSGAIQYRLSFGTRPGSGLLMGDESLTEIPRAKGKKPKAIMRTAMDGIHLTREDGKHRLVGWNEYQQGGTVLGMHQDRTEYPQNARTVEALTSMSLITDPFIGWDSPLRCPQSIAGLPAALLSDGSNLFLVVNRILQDPVQRERLESLVREVYPFVNRLEYEFAADLVQLVFVEKGWGTPASRLSDGLMRWVFLLALLLEPEGRSPIVIDGPELGLHFDAHPALAQLLVQASQRRQIIIATHNARFLDHFTGSPEAIVVVENAAIDTAGRHATRFSRLDPKAVADGIHLGEAWQKGRLGGRRRT